jgi:hypothetical protein
MKHDGEGLIAFLDYASNHGLMKSNTVGGLKSACKEVMQAVDGEGWAGVDLSTLDVNDYVERFERLRPGKYKPSTLNVYKNRFRNAVAMFGEYLESPGNWRFGGRQAAKSTTTSAGTASKAKQAAVRPQHPTPAPTVDDTTGPSVDYPFPLRTGLLVRLRLPADLTKQEAKRLAAFLDSVAVDSVPGPTSAPESPPSTV